MELIKRRKHTFSKLSRATEYPFTESFSNSNLASLNQSFVEAEKELSTVLTDCNLKKKASFVLKQIVKQNILEYPKEILPKRKKLSLMSQPKKKFLKSDLVNHIRTRFKGIQSSNTSRIYEEPALTQRDNLQTIQNSSQIWKRENDEQRKQLVPKQFLPLQGYFHLILSKISSSGKSRLVKIMTEQLNAWYEKHPKDIPRDVMEIRKIGNILFRALESKQNFVQLKPYEVMDINGTVPRLIFHFAHIISSRKYSKRANLLKIYHEIEYCSRSLEFNKTTLKICFIIGNLLKEGHQQEEAKNYYDKALKLSIHLEDRFHQQKALDLIGMSFFTEAKTSSAFFYHNNVEKLNPIERNMMKEKYNHKQQLMKIEKIRDSQRSQCNSRKLLTNFGQNKLQSYTFTGAEQQEGFEWAQRKDFKHKMSSYIRIPSMRTSTLKAKQSLEKIDKIGQVKRLKRFETLRANLVCKVRDQTQTSNQVLLTHRSLNRLKPQLQLKQIEGERINLLELLRYYTSDHLFNFSEMSDYLPAEGSAILDAPELRSLQ